MDCRTGLSVFAVLAAALLSDCGDHEAPTSAPAVSLRPLAPDELLTALAAVPARAGELPERTFSVPHLQLTQGGPVELADRLVEAIDRLDSVTIGSVTLLRDGGLLYDGRSWLLTAGAGGGPDAERFDGQAFGHMHHASNNSMHLHMPREVARGAVRDGGWGETHPFSAMNGLGTDNADYVMLWGARTEEELEIVWLLVQVAYAHARGLL